MTIFQKQFLHPRYWLSWIGLALMRLSIYLPGRFQIMIASLVGALIRPFIRSRANIARRNLELCFPELDLKQRQWILKQTLNNMVMMMMETAMCWWASEKSLRKRVRFEGEEHLEQAKAEGKGVILLVGHFTTMEIAGRMLMLKTPAYIVFRELKNRLFNVVMMRSRSHVSEGIIVRNDPRSMIRALKENKVVWYAPDQDLRRRKAVFAKFFGVPAATIVATAKLVRMTGARIVPFVPHREKDGSYTISFGTPWENYPSGDDLVDAQRINDWLEQEIRRAPEQYLWVHRRFKTQPGEQGSLYKNLS